MSETIKVEQGIERPVKSGLTHEMRRKLKKIDDTFLWPKEKRNGLHAAAKWAGVEIETSIKKAKPGYVRVWRVK